MTQPAHNLVVIGDTWLAREFTKEEDWLLKAIAQADYWDVPALEKAKTWQPFTQGWIKQRGPVSLVAPRVPVTYYRENMSLGNLFSIDEWDWNAVLDFSSPSVETLNWVVSLPELKLKTNGYVIIDPTLAYDVPETTYAYKFFTGYFEKLSESELQAYLEELEQRGFEREAVFVRQGIRLVTYHPGYLYGPGDTSGQLYAWLWRFAKRDHILVPDILDLRFQWAYAPDVVSWLTLTTKVSYRMKSASAHLRPIVTHEPVSYGDWLELMTRVSGRQPKIEIIAMEDMAAAGLYWERDFPLLRPTECIFDLNALLLECELNFNFKACHFADSIRETWDYFERLGWPEPTVGLSLTREDELLGF